MNRAEYVALLRVRAELLKPTHALCGAVDCAACVTAALCSEIDDLQNALAEARRALADLDWRPDA